MKKRSRVFLVLAAVVAALFLATGLYAAGAFEDVIKMEEKAYPHTKGIVEFSHAKHTTDYKAVCGDCHHDETGKALTALKKGDAAKRCIECHTKPGEVKGNEAKDMSDKDKRQYHANALHDNCRGCHKEYNKKNNTKAAPETCVKCHPKTDKDK